MGERFALDELHHEVGTIVELARVEQPHEVRVRESRERSHLRGEPLLVGTVGVAKHLHGDRSVEAHVDRPIDRAHSSTTDEGIEAVSLVEEAAEERIGCSATSEFR